MIRRYPYIVICLIVLFGNLFISCQKQQDVTDMSFTFNVLYVNTTLIYYDIYPQFNGVEYTTFVVSSAELNDKGTRAVIDSVQARIDEDHVYCTGIRMMIEDLQPGTRYYICCYRMDNKRNPIYMLIKHPVTTPIEKANDLTFEIAAEGSNLQILPSNSNDTYYWDYLTPEEADMEYMSNPLYYYYHMISYYETYEIMPHIVSQGPDKEDALLFYPNMEAGDTIIVMAGYYDVETRYAPEPYMWNAVYTDSASFRFVPYERTALD
ncbi:MAG: hypothetical protein MJZ82_05355 [Paludibacteraceae bacterium]|nr:hypothetical protein [Paludibacteraceae bacterium]